MTYEVKEISDQDGQIISLYEFKWGSTYWRYTSADKDIPLTQNGDDVIYTAVTISDDGVVQGGGSANDLTVSAQINLPLIELFRGTPPAGSIWLTVRRRHSGDPNDDWFVHWIGTIGNVKKGGIATAKIIGRTLLATFNRSGLRLAWTRNCPHMLYDSECRVDPVDFAVEAEITEINADGSITVDTAGGNPAGYFDGGFIEWTVNVDGTKDQRGIESSLDDTTFRIFGTSDRLEVGLAITLFPGCDLTATTCSAKFANLTNYGGLEQMTDENPFDGRNVF